MTANSASGSKYYDIKKPDATGTGIRGNGPDPLDPDKFWYNSVQNQEHVRSYVKVQVRGDKLVLANVRSGTCAAPNSSVENGSSCVNTPDGQPVGSIVDNVTVHPFHGDGQAIQVNVPNPAPGEFGWTIDGYNGLVDLGTAQERDGTYFQAAGKINPILVSDSRRSLARGRSRPTWVTSRTPRRRSPAPSSAGTRTCSTAARAPRPVPGPVVPRRPGQGPLGLQWARRGRPGSPRGGAKLGADLDLKIPDSIAKGSYRTTLTITALSS
ncbi:hypothetical protein NKG94_37180 [Micromonospora sp. M12]